MVRLMFCCTVWSATAFRRCSRSTSSEMMARRVGVMNVMTTPWNTPRMVTCHHEKASIASPAAVASANAAISAPATMSIVRFDIRSARAPAQGERTSEGAVFAATVSPSTRAERCPDSSADRSNASHGLASTVICMAPK